MDDQGFIDRGLSWALEEPSRAYPLTIVCLTLFVAAYLWKWLRADHKAEVQRLEADLRAERAKVDKLQEQRLADALAMADKAHEQIQTIRQMTHLLESLEQRLPK